MVRPASPVNSVRTVPAPATQANDLRRLCDLVADSNRHLQTLAKSAPTSNQELLRTIIAELRQLQLVTIEPPRFDGSPEVLVVVVTVVTPTAIQQAPDFMLPPGLVTTVRQRRHTATRYGYIGFSDVDVRNTNRRIELKDGDSFPCRIQNLNALWFDSDTANTSFEMFVDYAHDQGRVNPIPPPELDHWHESPR